MYRGRYFASGFQWRARFFSFPLSGGLARRLIYTPALRYGLISLLFSTRWVGGVYNSGCYRVIWHIFNAMIALLVILVAGIFILRQYPEHASLRPAALALVIVTGVQVLLGFSVYMVLPAWCT